MAGTATGERVRTFVAIHPSEEQRSAIVALVERLDRDVGTPGSLYRGDAGTVRWVPPHQAHLTLAFLGNVDRPRLDDVASAVSAVAAERSPFPLAFAGVGAFPDLRRPRIVWLGVSDGHDEVIEVAQAVRSGLSALGFGHDGAPFRPHLTLGRTRTGAGAPQLAALAEALGAVPEDEGTVTALASEVTVMASRIGHGGAVHSVVARLPFAVR